MMKIDVDGFLRNLNFEALHGKSVDLIKSSVRAVDDKTKLELLAWINKARRIRNDENVPKKARLASLRSLETSDVVVNFIKSLVMLMIGKFPYGTQTAAKMGFSGASLALSFMSFKRVAVVLYMIRLGLPSFIMSDKFEEFAGFVEDAFGVSSNTTNHALINS